MIHPGSGFAPFAFNSVCRKYFPYKNANGWQAHRPACGLVAKTRQSFVDFYAAGAGGGVVAHAVTFAMLSGNASCMPTTTLFTSELVLALSGGAPATDLAIRKSIRGIVERDEIHAALNPVIVGLGLRRFFILQSLVVEHRQSSQSLNWRLKAASVFGRDHFVIANA